MLTLELITWNLGPSDEIVYERLLRAQFKGDKLVVTEGHQRTLDGFGVPDRPIEDLDSDDPSTLLAFADDPERYVRMLPRRFGNRFRVTG